MTEENLNIQGNEINKITINRIVNDLSENLGEKITFEENHSFTNFMKYSGFTPDNSNGYLIFDSKKKHIGRIFIDNNKVSSMIYIEKLQNGKQIKNRIFVSLENDKLVYKKP